MSSFIVISVDANSRAPDAASMWPVMDFKAVAGIFEALFPKALRSA
ncbi:MAG: hypothetical protein M1508_14330 [Nitrospirae bacterium]|nr:hypothetical protein [Nitrospirota bacterium]MCL5421437.1 hypothetical protein [Nitrospirota bacterium]